MRINDLKTALFLAAALAASGCGGDGGEPLLDNDVPADPDALFEFLSSGEYTKFASESAAHASEGPHDGDVRVFLNPALEDSLAAGNGSHPKGAAAIKELGVQDGSPTGWAVFVKTAEDSAGGDGIYWYEIFSTTDGSDPPYSGNGLDACKGCHSGGNDFYLSAYPLQ
jgi:hypothetical protein